jgi:hypothetical protein
VAEDAFVSVQILESYYKNFKKDFESGDDNKRYSAIRVLRALTENPKTPKKILTELAQIHEGSLGHEIRNVNGGDDPDEAEQDSYIDWKAKETLDSL